MTLNTERWQKIIQNPNWYMMLYPELLDFQKQWEEEPDSEKTHASKNAVRGFFEMALDANKIALGTSGQNLDADREPIDSIVIHHTSSKPGYALPYMNAVQMLNVYVPYFNNPTGPGETKLKGSPLWSNHVRNGRPVFYLYHWLIRMDGSAVRLLKDHELGWHAANWEINKRSVGICLDNDYEHTAPPSELLRKLAEFIRKQYPHVSLESIWGHREVSQKSSTVCPGELFVAGWKKELLEYME